MIDGRSLALCTDNFPRQFIEVHLGRSCFLGGGGPEWAERCVPSPTLPKSIVSLWIMQQRVSVVSSSVVSSSVVSSSPCPCNTPHLAPETLCRVSGKRSAPIPSPADVSRSVLSPPNTNPSHPTPNPNLHPQHHLPPTLSLCLKRCADCTCVEVRHVLLDAEPRRWVRQLKAEPSPNSAETHLVPNDDALCY